MNMAQQIDYLHKCAEQRAFLMGMMRTILDEQDAELYGENTRQICLKTLAMMIDFKSMVRDDIDKDILGKAKTVCEQGIFLDDVLDIINDFD